MTKKEIIWLLIRLAGLWFLWGAIDNSITLFSSIVHAGQSPGLLSGSAGVFAQIILKLLINLALGLCCLGAPGSMIFDILNREDVDSNKGPGSILS